MKKEHKKKLIGPTIALIVFMILFVCMLIVNIVSIRFALVPIYARVMSLIIPIGAIGLMIYVYILRVKEIKEGKEDDISNY
jgi:hypothetical protein